MSQTQIGLNLKSDLEIKFSFFVWLVFDNRSCLFCCLFSDLHQMNIPDFSPLYPHWHIKTFYLTDFEQHGIKMQSRHFSFSCKVVTRLWYNSKGMCVGYTMHCICRVLYTLLPASISISFYIAWNEILIFQAIANIWQYVVGINCEWMYSWFQNILFLPTG